MYNLYSYRRKRPTGLILTLLLVFIIVASTGFLIVRRLKQPISFTKNVSNEESTEEASNIKKENVKYNENSDFNLNLFYSCGHNANSVSKVPPAFYGKTIEEIKNENPEYHIINYNDYSISANEYLSEECDNHYMLILNGNKLTSFNKKTPDVIEKEMNINLRDFLPDDIKILKSGIEVGSKTELLEYFENFAE